MSPNLRRRAVLGGLACIGALPAGAAPADDGIAVEAGNGRCIVPVRLDGNIARMVLDTGAERTVITRAAMRRLGLRADQWVDTLMQGAGGVLERHPNADVSRASLGGLPLLQRQPGGLSLSVTDSSLGDADGLLGGDILRHYVIDLDIPNARLALRPGRYANGFGAGAVALQAWRRDLLLAPVALDGQSLVALVDTGASTSLLNARGLFRLGLTPQRLAGDPAIPVLSLGGRLMAHTHRFAWLDFGALRLPQPLMLTAAVPEPAYDVTLGLDVLGRQRLLISYAALRLAVGS